MKKIIFMIMLMLITIPVYAKDNSFYYDNDKVEDMWITKINSEKSLSVNPYILKRISDNKYVYCLQAFLMMQKGVEYTLDYDYTKYGLSKSDIDRINLIIYYGYGYKNHTSKKWYGITQYLIWKITDKDSTIYFTNEKNGSKKDLYKDEINEIENLITEHNKNPNFIKDYIISTNDNLSIDSNINLDNYIIESDAKYKVINNKIVFDKLNKGNYKFKLSYKDNKYNTDYLLYYNKNSQNIIIPGHSTNYNKEYEFNIIVKEGSLEINKTSNDNKKLKGAVYGIFKDDVLQYKVETNDDGNSKINIPFGKYKVKEISAPVGYLIDDKEYEINIDFNNTDVVLNMKDSIIKAEVNIIKKSNYTNMFLEGATYGVYKDNKLITKLITNNKGISSISLEYGDYIIKELESPKGYKLDTKEYIVNINSNKSINLYLYDDKEIVKVPDTYLKQNSSYIFIIIGIIGLIYGKKKYNMY